MKFIITELIEMVKYNKYHLQTPTIYLTNIHSQNSLLRQYSKIIALKIRNCMYPTEHAHFLVFVKDNPSYVFLVSNISDVQ